MSAYLPTVPSASSDFSADSPDSSFDDFALWSSTVGDYASGNGNIRNDKLVPASAFQPNSLTRVFRSGSSSPEAFLLMAAGSSSTLPWLDYNKYGYDVPGASVNFYLKEDVPVGNLIIHSSVNIWKAREASYFDHGTNNTTAAGFQLDLKGLIDGSDSYNNGGVLSLAKYDYYIAPSGSTSSGDFTRRGFNLFFSTTNDAVVPAGLHTYKLKMGLSQTSRTGSTPGDATLYNHFKGSGARTSIIAIYK